MGYFLILRLHLFAILLIYLFTYLLSKLTLLLFHNIPHQEQSCHHENELSLLNKDAHLKEVGTQI
jgi:hypothetical protein